jgi:hypothetical protein
VEVSRERFRRGIRFQCQKNIWSSEELPHRSRELADGVNVNVKSKFEKNDDDEIVCGCECIQVSSANREVRQLKFSLHRCPNKKTVRVETVIAILQQKSTFLPYRQNRKLTLQ